MIEIGDTFDTDYETGCVATSNPDDTGNFFGRDSDGIICQYHVIMVICVTSSDTD